MIKRLLLVAILGLVFACASPQVTQDFDNLKDWPDEELMVWHERLDPFAGVAVGVGNFVYAVGHQKERRAIRQELEARGYVYHPENKQSAFEYSGDHRPEWVKSK